MSQIIIAGFSPNDRVPGFFGETLLGVGPISAASLPIKVLLVGNKVSAGTATASQDVDRILSESDADTLYGAGSELARMCYAALKVSGVLGNVPIYGAPLGDSGGTAATCTITIAGSWASTATGVLTFSLCGELIPVVITTSMTSATLVANAVTAAFNGTASANSRLPVSAANTAGVVTLTAKNAGTRGNQLAVLLDPDTSTVPTGMTVAFSGGAALTDGCYLSTGTATTETNSTLQGILATERWNRIALALSTAGGSETPIAGWTSWNDAQAGATINFLQQLILAATGDGAETTHETMAATLNNARTQLVYVENSEIPGPEIAASVAVVRAVYEQQDPAHNIQVTIPGLLPQRYRGDRPIHSQKLTMINAGVSPLETTDDGKVVMVKSICTHTLSNGQADYRVHSTSDVTVADYVRDDIKLFWVQVFRPNNPRVADDPPSGAPRRPTGVATPQVWTAAVLSKLRDYELGTGFPAPIIVDVDTHLPTSVFDTTRKCIMSAIPVVAAPSQDQIGVSIRQMAI